VNLVDDEVTQTVAVTGAGGYVGSRLVRLLAARPGVAVRALTRAPCPLPDDVEQFIGDVLVNDGGLAKLLDGADTVVHLAGPNEVEAAADPGHTVVDVVSAAMRVAEDGVRAGVARAVYISTVHVYGASLRPGAHVDEGTPCEPQSAYAIGRLAAEELLSAYGPPGTVVFRLTNAVGAPASGGVQRSSLVANDLCRQGVTTGRLRLRGDGLQWRDFVALSDVCRIVADVAVSNRLDPGIYNLGHGRPLRVRDLAAMIQDEFEAAGADRPVLEMPASEAVETNPPKVSVARLARAGFRAVSPIRGAVAETIQFCLAHREELR